MNAITKAIEVAGGPRKLADALGLENAQTVTNWRARGAAPVDMGAAIERATGVSRRELFPNDWARIWPELADRAAA